MDEREPAEWEGLIASDPAVLVGKPVIKGTRLAVEYILDLLAGGHSTEEILTEFPGITRQQVLACIAYARDTVHDVRVLELRRRS